MNDQDVHSAPQVNMVLPGYLSEEVIPEVADVLYFPKLSYWLPTGFTDVEYDAVAGFPSYCSKYNIDLPDAVWNLISWHREADEHAFNTARILQPLHSARAVQYLLPVYGRGRREVEVARQAITASQELRDSLSAAPFDARMFARELVGHALFGVYFEDGYEGSVETLRRSTGSDEELTMSLGAASVNRISAMLRSGMTATVYDQRWIPLLAATEEHQELGQRLRNRPGKEGWEVDYSTFRIFSEILRPSFGRCDTVAKNYWVMQMRERRADDILQLRLECREVALIILAASNSAPYVQTEILRNELRRRISDPLRALGSDSRAGILNVPELTRDVAFDSGVVAAMIGIFTGFDPRAIVISAASAAAASIGRKMFESASLPGHLSLLRDGLIATEGEYSDLRRSLSALTLQEVSA